ncbi:MAG: isopenicillin N synthase-like dioxygenase [Parasphingorhabdus sp.]
MNIDHTFRQIPVVDLKRSLGTPLEQARFAQELCDICHHIGFFQVINHGISDQFIDNLFGMLKQLFALPQEKKLLIDKIQSPHFRGWEDVGSEYTNNHPDIREQVDLWSERNPCNESSLPAYYHLLGPNQWLPNEILPEFKSLSLEWFTQAGELANRLLTILTEGLELPPGSLTNLFKNDSMSLVKLIHYPPTPNDAAGVNPHHDTGFVTVLAPGETAGLEVQNSLGEWIPVPVRKDAFVINLGEMLQGMTGNYFVATPHRVITQKERYSVGYFHGPRLDTATDLLPLKDHLLQAVQESSHHATAGFMPLKEENESGVETMQSTYKPSVYGEQLWNYFIRSYPDNVKRHYPDLVSY